MTEHDAPFVNIARLKPHPHNRRIYGKEDIADLVQQMRDSQHIKPLIVTPAYTIISGHRRWQAARQLGYKRVPAFVHTFASPHDELAALLVENQQRVKTVEQRVREAQTWETIEREKAKERQTAGVSRDGKAGGRGKKKNLVEKFPQGFDTGKSRDQVARHVGLGSGKTYQKAAQVVALMDAQDAQGNTAEAAVLRNMLNHDSINAAAKVLTVANQAAVLRALATGQAKNVRMARNTVTAAQLKAAPPALPTGPFSLLVVDPPWQYDKRAEDASHRAALPYPSLSIAQLAALTLPPLTPNAILWLWTTNAHMHHAFDILQAWGFQQKTILTWVKDRMGTGDWLRGQTEHCLLAIKGTPTVTLTNQTTYLAGPVRQHSRKPESFYALVESLCPTPPNGKCELFARQSRAGWVTWGAESTHFQEDHHAHA